MILASFLFSGFANSQSNEDLSSLSRSILGSHKILTQRFVQCIIFFVCWRWRADVPYTMDDSLFFFLWASDQYARPGLCSFVLLFYCGLVVVRDAHRPFALIWAVSFYWSIWNWYCSFVFFFIFLVLHFYFYFNVFFLVFSFRLLFYLPSLFRKYRITKYL